MDHQANRLATAVTAVFIIVFYIAKTKRKNQRPRPTKYLDIPPKYSITDIFLNNITSQDGYRIEKFLGLNQEEFKLLLKAISPKLRKQDRHKREIVNPCDRFALTLRFLVTGDSCSKLRCLFRMSPSAITRSITEVCDVIYEVLANYIRVPQNEEEWLLIAKEFNNRFSFPNCLGALDGKYITLQAPSYSNNLLYGHKQSFNIVLTALVDAKWNFIYVNMKRKGRENDHSFFKNCSLYQGLLNNTMHLPSDRALPNEAHPMPYVVIAGHEFPLKRCIMKPFPGSCQEGSKEQLFNDRFWCIHSCVENAFQLLSNVFGILRKPLCVYPEKAIKIVRACLALHNFKRRNICPESLDGVKRNGMSNFRYQQPKYAAGMYKMKDPSVNLEDNTHVEAEDIRNLFAYYLLKERQDSQESTILID